MPATFDEHVNQALALIARDRRPAARPRTRPAHTRRPHLSLVPRPDSEGGHKR